VLPQAGPELQQILPFRQLPSLQHTPSHFDSPSGHGLPIGSQLFVIRLHSISKAQHVPKHALPLEQLVHELP
jgi:hypothetical protein